MDKDIHVKCPYCQMKIIIEKINCGIMRCGIYKLKNGKWKQMPEHGKKEKITKIIENSETIGCGNPIKYEKKSKILVKIDWNT